MTEQMKNEISNMNTIELDAAIRVLGYQVNAPLFIGDRAAKSAVLEYLNNEKKNRGI